MSTRSDIRPQVNLLMGNRNDLTSITSGGAQGYDLVNNAIRKAYMKICTLGFYHGSDSYYRQLNLPELESKFIITPGTYTTGTIAVTNGSVYVTGSSTVWLSYVTEGDQITIGTSNYVVGYVISDTYLALKTTYGGTNASGLSYTVYTARVNIDSTIYSIINVYDITDDRDLDGDVQTAYFQRQRTNGDPNVWVRFGNSLYLDPSPTKALSIRITARVRPTPLTNDNVVIVTPDEYENGIVLASAIECAESLGDLELAKYLTGKLDKFIDEVFPRDDGTALNSSVSTCKPML